MIFKIQKVWYETDYQKSWHHCTENSTKLYWRALLLYNRAEQSQQHHEYVTAGARGSVTWKVLYFRAYDTIN